MAAWQIILLAIAGLVGLAIGIEAFVKRNRPRPPLARQFLGDDMHEEADDEPELGMEATDMEVIRASELANKSAAALGARDMDFWTRRTRFKRKKTNENS